MGNPGAARDLSGLTMDRPVRKVNGVDAHEAAEIFARQFPAMYLRFHPLTPFPPLRKEP